MKTKKLNIINFQDARRKLFIKKRAQTYMMTYNEVETILFMFEDRHDIDFTIDPELLDDYLRAKHLISTWGYNSEKREQANKELDRIYMDDEFYDKD